jgi:maltose O-acetyltransferase
MWSDQARRIWWDLTLNKLAGSYLIPQTLRWRVYRAFGVRVSSSSIRPKCWFGGTDVTIGQGCWINYGVWFDNSAPIVLGERVNVGHQVLFATSSHELGTQHRRSGPPAAAAIVIGDGTWIGARATIMSGVRIGKGCMIGAGALVAQDCQANGMYVGVPARRVRELGD